MTDTVKPADVKGALPQAVADQEAEMNEGVGLSPEEAAIHNQVTAIYRIKEVSVVDESELDPEFMASLEAKYPVL